MAIRSCGGCTACCQTYAVPELPKPAGASCNLCEIGKGCTVYANRPETCRDFQCAWIAGEGREEDRPDKTGIVLEFTRIQGKGWMAVPAGTISVETDSTPA